MKNHKGFVPALLTLGLVLVGSLVTLGVSFLTNSNKITSNSRAADTCGTGFYYTQSTCDNVCSPESCDECAFAGKQAWKCVVEGVGACNKSRTYASLCNCIAEDKDGPCSQCKIGDTIRWENDDGPNVGDSCPSVPGENSEAPGAQYAVCPYVGIDACTTSGCSEKNCVTTKCQYAGYYRCTSQQAGVGCTTTTNCANEELFPDQNYSNLVLISMNKKGEYFASAACFDVTKVANLSTLDKYCYDQSSFTASQPCVPNNLCTKKFKNDSGINNNKYAYSSLNGVITYYKGNSCYETVPADDETDLKTNYCTTVKEPPPINEDDYDCNEGSSETLCVDLPDIDASKIKATNLDSVASYKKINETIIYYYKNTTCYGSKVTNTSIINYCNSQKPITNPGTYFTGKEKSYKDITYSDCREPEKLGWTPLTKRYVEGQSEQDCVDFFGEDPKPAMYKTSSFFYCCRQIK